MNEIEVAPNRRSRAVKRAIGAAVRWIFIIGAGSAIWYALGWGWGLAWYIFMAAIQARSGL